MTTPGNANGGQRPPALEVCAATVEDRAAAARLLLAYHVERGDPVDADDVARAVELALAPRSTAWLALAMRSGMCVGVALANPVIAPLRGGAALRVEALYVPPTHRRRGVGRALVAYLCAEARTAGLQAVEMDVRPDDDAALALGQATGFAVEERKGLVRSA